MRREVGSNMEEKSPIITLKNFCKRYSICSKTGRKWLRTWGEELQPMKIGKMLYVPNDALKKFEESRASDFKKIYRPKGIL